MLPDGSLKPGFGGRFFGGLMSLLTGIPFVGGAIGSMYDKGKGIFGSKPRDMSEYNRLGLFGLPPGTLDEDEDEKIGPIDNFTLQGLNRFPNSSARFGNINLGTTTPVKTNEGIVATDAFTGQLGDPNFGFISEENQYGEGGA